jgi:hypothetical protein
MSVFDSALMLRNTTQTLSSTIAGVAGLTGNWLTIGTGGGPAHGLSFRAIIATSAGSNTDSANLIYEFSDDQSVINETVTQLVTATMAGGGTSGGYLLPATGDVLTRVSTRRAYVRLRATVSGLGPNFGVVTVGVDGGDFNADR